MQTRESLVAMFRVEMVLFAPLMARVPDPVFLPKAARLIESVLLMEVVNATVVTAV